jgi:hypothetical protein
MTRDEIEALVARERPGWRVTDVVEVNDESGPSFEVAIERGDEHRTLLVSEDMTIVGERRVAGRSVGPEDEGRKSPGGPQVRLATDVEPSGS